MKIMVSKHAGYCYGVKRAIRILDEVVASTANQDEKIYTLGPIIHNEQVTTLYKSKGVTIINAIEDMTGQNGLSNKIVIRSHGAPKSVYDQIQDINAEIFDATCPYVKKIQNTVSTHASIGYNIIIVGDGNHPEVVGINGWCDNQAIVVNSVEAAQIIKPMIGPVCVVAQTTFNINVWNEIVVVLKEKFENCVIHNTICLATNQRQTACRELASQVDLMIVIGGKHSSNTLKLASICKEIVNTIHIETKDDLDLSILSGNEVIGITAGASTPDWIIDSVILKIENEGEVFFDGKS